MLAYNRDRAKKSLAYKRFKKYFLKGMHFSKEKKMRLFFSKAEGTIVIYTKIVKDYVKYMHRKENKNAFPVTETSLRRYIDNLDLEKDRGKFPNIKAAMLSKQPVIKIRKTRKERNCQKHVLHKHQRFVQRAEDRQGHRENVQISRYEVHIKYI